MSKDTHPPSPEENKLARQYRLRSLLAFATPTILMVLFTSLYTIVDGIFVARYVGTLALSALNMFFPIMSIEFGFAVMLYSGGSALIARKMGEGRTREARARFTALVLLMSVSGGLIALAGLVFSDELVYALGASAAQFDDCRTYMRMHFLFVPCLFLQFVFQSFFVVAGRPSLGLAVSLAAGILNMLLDYLFMVPWEMGVRGAALATGLGCVVPTVVGLWYFGCNRRQDLRFCLPSMPLRDFFRICSNGLSEMVTHLANFIVGYLFNISFMAWAGEDGVAAITIVFYFEFVFTAVFFGYSSGIAPIVSYKFGHGDRAQLHFIFRRSLLFLLLFSLAAFSSSIGTLSFTLPIFVETGSAVFELARAGFPLYAWAFLLMGWSIFASAWFTALSNGPVSALISLGRTFVFLAGSILLLPRLLGIDGLWLALPTAELLGLGVTLFFFLCLRKRYGY